MDSVLQMMALVSWLCSGSTNCSVIPKPLNANTYLVEICRKGATPAFGKTYRLDRYTVETVIKPTELCSSQNRPPDWLDKLNDWQ